MSKEAPAAGCGLFLLACLVSTFFQWLFTPQKPEKPADKKPPAASAEQQPEKPR